MPKTEPPPSPAAAPVVDLAYCRSPACRQDLIRAAFDLYAGPSQPPCTLREVARRANVPTAVAARHFADEGEVRREVREQFFRWLLPRALLASQRRFRRASRPYSEDEMIQTFFKVLSRMLQRYPALFSEDLTQSFQAKDRQARTSLFIELLESLTPELAETIRQGQLRGGFSAGLDCRVGAGLVKNLVNGGALQCLTLDLEEDAGLFFQHLCDQTLHLLHAQPDSWERWAE